MRPSTRLLTKARPALKTSITTRTLTTQTSRLTSKMSATGIPSTTAPLSGQGGAQIPGASQTQTSGMSTSAASGIGGDSASYGIESTSIQTAAGVELNERQKVLVGSVLDLFKGLPTHKKMSLWSDTATFADPITKAQGRKQYEAQWWGLKAAFSEIEQQHHSVTSAGNPITMDLKTRYKVKGLGTEKVMESVVRIHTDEKGEKIVQVEDRWNGNLPEGPIATAFRNLNSVVVPALVGVPKNDGTN